MRVLILCTGNSCRSQMAHGFLQSFDKEIEVFSAGTKPAEKVNPRRKQEEWMVCNYDGVQCKQGTLFE